MPPSTMSLVEKPEAPSRSREHSSLRCAFQALDPSVPWKKLRSGSTVARTWPSRDRRPGLTNGSLSARKASQRAAYASRTSRRDSARFGRPNMTRSASARIQGSWYAWRPIMTPCTPHSSVCVRASASEVTPPLSVMRIHGFASAAACTTPCMRGGTLRFFVGSRPRRALRACTITWSTPAPPRRSRKGWRKAAGSSASTPMRHLTVGGSPQPRCTALQMSTTRWGSFMSRAPKQVFALAGHPQFTFTWS
mmetsp:Transcript_20710/g.69473  ORF Transcript_20710/g.69473 Transcript_20710/m.69473 type:complete len:250 (+) Transcript_20710:298-1047(+)